MRSLRQASVALALALALLFVTRLEAQPSIGIYLDPECTRCSGTSEFLVPFTFYIAAHLEPPVTEIAGASFRVDGLPESWNRIYAPIDCEPNPALSFVYGNPFEGTAVTFENNCSGAAACLILFTCHAVPFATESNVRLSVEPWPVYPCPMGFCCAVLNLCDAPIYTSVCIAGGEATFNGPPCTVGVHANSWTQLKRLYE